MSYLFISRKNVHARYYKILTKRLQLDCELYVMGMPKWSALSYLKQAFSANFDQILNEQLQRKQAYNKIWNNPLLASLYSITLTFLERLRYAKYLAILKQKKPTHLVIWNGQKLPNITVVKAAKSLNINIFYFENGLLPDTVSLDPKGINFLSSLSKDPNFYLEYNLSDTFSPPTITPRKSSKKRNKFSPIELPERYIFVPFQVPHDTQIVCHSSWVQSMEAFYDEVIKAVRNLKDPSLKVVFKEHPSWHKHYDSLYLKDPLGVFANGNDTVELIEKSVAVLTINSTVGLESLLLNKEVITLGDACYNIEGLVLHANNQQQLVNCLTQMNQGWKANDQLRMKFFSYLEYVYCIPRISKDDPDHIQAVQERLIGSDSFSQQK